MDKRLTIAKNIGVGDRIYLSSDDILFKPVFFGALPTDARFSVIVLEKYSGTLINASTGIVSDTVIYQTALGSLILEAERTVIRLTLPIGEYELVG